MTDDEIHERTAACIKELVDLNDSGIIMIGRIKEKRSDGMLFGDGMRVIEDIANGIAAVHRQWGYDTDGVLQVLKFMLSDGKTKPVIKDLGDFSEEDFKKALEEVRKH